MLRQVVIVSARSEILSAQHCWLQRPMYFLNKLIEFPPLSGLEEKEKGRMEVLFYDSSRDNFVSIFQIFFWSFHGKYRIIFCIC